MAKIPARTIPFGVVVPSGMSEEKQNEIFRTVGYRAGLIDTGGKTDYWDGFFVENDVLALNAGDTILLACEAYLGYPGRQRASRLKKLSNAGVYVCVVGEDPVLYDTEEKRKAFVALASGEAMKARGEKAKETLKPGPGKPGKILVYRHEWDAAAFWWQNSRAARSTFVEWLQTASKRNGMACDSITDRDLHSWLGRREPGSKTEPPPNIIKKD